MDQQQVLVVEDEVRISELIKKYLLLESYIPTCLYSGSDVMNVIDDISPDLVLLDINLPGINGIDICKKIRQTKNTPIIMLTARIDEMDRLIGFESGADDYVCKPFSPRELMARIRAVLRRSPVEEKTKQFDSIEDVIQCADVVLDVEKHRVTIVDVDIKLTGNEFSILHKLMSCPGRVYSRCELLTASQGDQLQVYERTIDSHIRNLRKKFKCITPGKEYIESIYGVGYSFRV